MQNVSEINNAHDCNFTLKELLAVFLFCFLKIKMSTKSMIYNYWVFKVKSN